MPDQLYDIFFAGQTLEGVDPAEVRAGIGRMFHTEGAALERLFSGEPVRVKVGVDQETAIKYRVAFRSAGALVDIKPSDQPAPAAMTLLPPRTGNLLDCAPKVEAFPLPDISDLVLLPEGSKIDESEPAPPPNIDVSGLTLRPPRSGTLEDCYDPGEPAPIPDIDHLRIV